MTFVNILPGTTGDAMNDAAGLESDGFDLGDVLGGQSDGSPVPESRPAAGLTAVDLDQRGRERDRSQGGRPTLYTVPRVLTILAALFDSASRDEPARRAGVGVSTLYGWLQLGRAGHPTFGPLAEAVANVERSGGFNRAFSSLIVTGRFRKLFP
jgi:hypothetical protein